MSDKKIKRKSGTIQIILTVLLVGAAFAIGSMWTELRMLKSSTKPQVQPTVQVSTEGAAFVKGSEEASVTLVEFTDYQCPFCKRYVDQTYNQLVKDYVETGKVKYVLRDLPLSFHANAQKAAEAARCAGDKEKYEEYHASLFKNQTAWSEVADPIQVFTDYATALGLNQVEFSSCLTTGKYEQAVKDDLALAQEVGASGTPTFFVNKKILVGAQPLAAFQALIEGELE